MIMAREQISTVKQALLIMALAPLLALFLVVLVNVGKAGTPFPETCETLTNLRIQDLASFEEAPFDGLISAFASLNSLPDLANFANDAARLVRPGGRVVLHMLNRFSVWEWLGCVARRDWSAARGVGRLHTRAFVIGGQSVQHAVYFADEAYRRFFAREFVKRGEYGLGALRPPHTVRRIPSPIVVTLERLDVRLGGWPLLKNAGRFFVLDLERRSA